MADEPSRSVDFIVEYLSGTELGWMRVGWGAWELPDGTIRVFPHNGEPVVERLTDAPAPEV